MATMWWLWKNIQIKNKKLATAVSSVSVEESMVCECCWVCLCVTNFFFPFRFFDTFLILFDWVVIFMKNITQDDDKRGVMSIKLQWYISWPCWKWWLWTDIWSGFFFVKLPYLTEKWVYLVVKNVWSDIK